MLDAEEYVEQAYYYRALRERMQEGMSTQELLISISHEVLSTTKLPMALSVRNIKELDHPLHTVVRFDETGSLLIAPFAPRLPLSGIKFQSQESMRLQRDSDASGNQRALGS